MFTSYSSMSFNMDGNNEEPSIFEYNISNTDGKGEIYVNYNGDIINEEYHNEEEFEHRLQEIENIYLQRQQQVNELDDELDVLDLNKKMAEQELQLDDIINDLSNQGKMTEEVENRLLIEDGNLNLDLSEEINQEANDIIDESEELEDLKQQKIDEIKQLLN